MNLYVEYVEIDQITHIVLPEDRHMTLCGKRFQGEAVTTERRANCPMCNFGYHLSHAVTYALEAKVNYQRFLRLAVTAYEGGEEARRKAETPG